MAKKSKGKSTGADPAEPRASDELDPTNEDVGDELVPEGKLVCALTGQLVSASAHEELLQSLIEQLHREYGVPIEDMARDVRLPCYSDDSNSGKSKTRMRAISLVVYESAESHEPGNIIRVAIVAKPGAKPEQKSLDVLDEVLGSLSQDRAQVFGLWTNGTDLTFRMRTYHSRTGEPEYVSLTDFPAPSETLEDLESGTRRPLRIATKDSLLQTFKRCHNYLYGNQSMRGDRAFWQLLFLIFCKIHDEQQSKRLFFVGATEANSEDGRKRVFKRIHQLFEQVQKDTYKDVFDGTERIELNDRALAYIAGELGRYSLLNTDTDAKGMAYEAITSSTLKRERGQFFTPRNVIRMMVEMVAPKPKQLVLDPACGSGGFLVVALNHIRRHIIEKFGGNADMPVPSELKKSEKAAKDYARACLFGLDVDPELRKAARMNMVMNGDGHGNMLCFNSLEYGLKERRSPEMGMFERAGGGHGKFDYVFTNPPFGSKIPISDSVVLESFDLGHVWAKSGKTWQKRALQKRVSPEILFIEACYKFLKPGTGVMAIVLPNGILGNPGEQMEAVRWWIMYHLEMLASVDLPAETFLPQVSVQASCVFLRRRDSSELRLLGGQMPKQAPVFMAIAEQCGHGRRGEVRYVRGPDGVEDIVTRDILDRWEHDGKLHEKARRQKVRVLADDFPWIAEQYRRHVAGEPLEES